jgi:hypothetical protein
MSDDIVVVIDEQNNIRSRSRPIKGTKDLVKDPYGNINLIAEKTAFKIHPGNSALRVDTMPVDLARLNWSIQYCDEVNNNIHFIRRYKDNNQTVAFFAMSDLQGNKGRLLKEISGSDRKYCVAAFANEANSLNQYVANVGLSKGSASTLEELELVNKAIRMTDRLEMNYTLPSYSYLKLVNDSIYLFAHDIDTMFVYDQDCNLVKSKRINYHHLKTWGQELIVNEEKTRVYAKLIENSKTIIVEIDLQTGTLKPTSTTLGTKFPAKIKIRNNTAFFMAKQKSRIGYTVYSQNLQ